MILGLYSIPSVHNFGWAKMFGCLDGLGCCSGTLS